MCDRPASKMLIAPPPGKHIRQDRGIQGYLTHKKPHPPRTLQCWEEREREGIGSKSTRLSRSRNYERCVLNQIRSQALWSGEASSIKRPLDQQRARSLERETNILRDPSNGKPFFFLLTLVKTLFRRTPDVNKFHDKIRSFLDGQQTLPFCRNLEARLCFIRAHNGWRIVAVRLS